VSFSMPKPETVHRTKSIFWCASSPRDQPQIPGGDSASQQRTVYDN
jgi:hypothetical protein